jgi:Xaa-Pro dipeptidase
MGVKMEDLHLHAARTIMEGLKDAGVVKGSVDDMMENDIFALFFPHGLGHFLGLDTHDVGGYPKGVERIDRPGIKFLRVRRDLQPGMVVTIEPGAYFVPALLVPALEDDTQKQFLNAEKLTNMFEFGGIRIEGNVVVREDGCENLTDVPKERSEIEKLIRG